MSMDFKSEYEFWSFVNENNVKCKLTQEQATYKIYACEMNTKKGEWSFSAFVDKKIE